MARASAKGRLIQGGHRNRHRSCRSVLTAAGVGGTEHLGALSASHGLLPRVPPARMLPSSHRAWDEAAEQLPALWRDTAALRVLAGLPLLDASSAALSPEHLWRASVVMACIAFSYVRCDLEDLHLPVPVALPEAIERPWRQLAARMRRSAPHVAHDDLVTHNWRLLDAHLADPMRLENLALSVPITGNDTERASLAAQIEVLAQLAPAVEAMVRAQEAVVADDRDALMPELLLILERLRHVTDVSLPNAGFRTGTSALGSGEFEAELAAVPPGDGCVSGEAGFAEDG